MPSKKLPILKSKIIEAQQHTKSNMAAARYLGEPYRRYRTYAKIYGLFDSHANQSGVGIDKGFARTRSTVKLKDIFAGKHPNYSLVRLKRRMINRGLLVEACTLCGFHERRITDGKIPLILTFKDGNRKNLSQDNIHLLCYNCMFLTTGLPQLAHRKQLEKAMATPPEQLPKAWYKESNMDRTHINEDLTDAATPAGTPTNNTPIETIDIPPDTIVPDIEVDIPYKELPDTAYTWQDDILKSLNRHKDE